VLLCLGAGAYYLYTGRPKHVTVATARLAPVSEIVYATGTIEPIQWAKVVPLQRKPLVELCQCEGQHVKYRQVLGRQDDTEERAVLKEMDARHQQLQRDLDRAEKDRKDDKITKAELEQKQTAVKESSSRIAAQQSRLESLVLRSPMDGMVLRRDGEIGEIVGPTEVLFWVGKPSPLQIVAEINEEEITKIAPGQTALVSNEAFGRESLRAKISQITPKGDPTKKTFRVFMQLPENTPLRIGMSVEVNIVYREKPAAVVVPLDALSDGAVQVVEDGHIRRVPVSTGVRGARYVEIIGNVAAGTAVVSPARVDLADGTRVQADRSKEPAVQTARADSSPDKSGPTSGSLDQTDKPLETAAAGAGKNGSASGSSDRTGQTFGTTWDQPTSDADTYYNRGLAKARAEEYALAVDDFGKALQLNPNDPEALNNRCWARAVLGRLEGALIDCDEALRLRPNYADAFDSRGLVHLKLGDLDRAISDFNAALRLNPELASSLYGRGKARLRGGAVDRGNADIKAAKQRDPGIERKFSRYGVN
jgi:RND family efflux transporter MFP subunit